MITNAKILGCEKNEELNGPLTIENQMAPYSICKALKTHQPHVTTTQLFPIVPNYHLEIIKAFMWTREKTKGIQNHLHQHKL
jgi:hypothetical protein